jgi:hypothetical protein
MYGRAKLDLLQARLIGNHGCTKVASEPKIDPLQVGLLRCLLCNEMRINRDLLP